MVTILTELVVIIIPWIWLVAFGAYVREIFRR